MPRRFRFRHGVHPPDLKELRNRIAKLNNEKMEAVAEQDFERAASLRDKAEKLTRKADSINRAWQQSAEESSGVVDDEVIVGRQDASPVGDV